MLYVKVFYSNEQIDRKSGLNEWSCFPLQALVQREQLKEELTNMRKRVEEHTESMNTKMQEERELVRKETKIERNELNIKVAANWLILTLYNIGLQKLLWQFQ